MMPRFLIPLILTLPALAEPITTSWFTELSGQYARIYPTATEESTNTPTTSWNHPNGGTSQPTPTYAGVSEISKTDDNLYIRTTGLAFHVMGPWYGGNGNLFPNYPANIARTARFPLMPVEAPMPKPLTGLGAIGYFIDGVAMFDSRDAFSYINASQSDAGPATAPIRGDGIWNRDAYVNESDTFDPAFAHQAGATHHYHANPPGLRHLLGDSVNYDTSSNSYTEAPDGGHSPILAWTFDGFPLYGPYGYSDPLDPASGVRRMISGYQMRDGSNGSTNLATTGRTTLPAWITRNETTRTNPLATGQFGPAISATYTLGHYLEDYAYKGDLGMTLGNDFDLNEYNVRWCVTPEFPEGTYAYFTCIAADGTPVFPYNISRYYFGTVQGANNVTIPATATTLWEGGPEAPLNIENLAVDRDSGDVTLTWSTVEGGQYTIESSDLSEPFLPIASPRAGGSKTVITDFARANNEPSHFYRAELNYLAPFDDNGFAYDNSIISEGPQNNVLLMILDDWGIDSSELYNEEPGAQLARMPHLETLANAGLLFTRGYAQPICSPTRATLLTGRQPYQHTVGNPQADSTLPSSELTFPEIIATEAPQYGLASFGKWHLGSGSTGPFDTGGWPNFTGTLSGGVPDYAAWTRVKIENGSLTDSGTDITTLIPGSYDTPYATSVQIDEAVSFITDRGTDPWVVWMGFNAPHDPFHDPEPHVTIPGGYSTSGTTNRDYYVKMLEALDHEIGRLLESVDLTTTNIIVVGDNGTPGQVDQAPAGGLAAAKGSLNEGGIHVPFFAVGPDVTVTGTTDKMVHVVDLFATILELTNVNVPTATQGIDIHSQSIVPIFRGNDTADRGIIAEKFNLNDADGRALMMDDWPQYKLISFQDVTDPDDIPTYQMYELGSNGAESNTLTTPPNPGDPHEAAYLALVAKDQSLVPATPVVIGDTLYLQLPDLSGPAGVPNNAGLAPDTITVDGVEATFVARFDPTNVYNRLWVQCTLPDTVSSPYTNAVVAFSDNPNTGDTRVFTAENIYVAP